ncbi:hypothetical protein ACGC1H_001108 [Rhizoctonia solani]|uniref:Uncharacterized protein n=1 Tax=Rhizoctonia solani TaxID=456999 RepID=A0A8H3H012_9AGAM|nr:unnamed protein product [Rhizoctonia solani]
MVAFIWNLALLAVAVPALAIPAPTETPDLSKRTIIDGRTADCLGVQFFQQAAVVAAGQAAVNHVRAKTTVGTNKYPHVFRNKPENFVFQAGCNPPYWEFPIMPNGAIFAGRNNNQPGTERVVIGSISSTSNDAHLCGVMTHIGATGNGFKECILT